MDNAFNIKLEEYSFSKKGILDLKRNSLHPEDWPVVYILTGSKEAYVGETQNVYNRMNQHLSSIEGKRKNLSTINVVQSNSFNKSAILDIENLLISHMHADKKYKLQNANGGQSKLHNYYQRVEYQNVFANLWEQLKQINLVNHELFEIENLDIFKYSPFKELTFDQYQTIEKLIASYVEAIKSDKQKTVIVNGGAGTGKTIVAIYFINLMMNILNNNFDFTDVEENDNLLDKVSLIKTIKEYGSKKIGFVIPVPSFKSTVKKVFKSIPALKDINVISPSEISDGDYDILLVDEAHRLKRRYKLTNYGKYDDENRKLGLPLETTELDWVKLQANKMIILFYDNKQKVKESDVLKEDFEEIEKDINTDKYILTSQLRVKGGNEYIDFINNLFSDNPSAYNLISEYDLKIFDDCHLMYEEIKNKNKEYKGLCRTLSGISFPWRKKMRNKKSTQYEQDYDFEIEGYHYCWNKDFNASDYITNDSNVESIGCIYTSQGHDLNYAGVIIGPDVKYNPISKKIEYDTKKFGDRHSKSTDDKETIANIINAYKVLLTRGVYGTYIYAYDKNLREYLKSLLID